MNRFFTSAGSVIGQFFNLNEADYLTISGECQKYYNAAEYCKRITSQH